MDEVKCAPWISAMFTFSMPGSTNCSLWMSDIILHIQPPPSRSRLQACPVSSLLQKPGMDLADTYITFVRQNQDILRDRVNDELYIEKVFDVSAESCFKRQSTFCIFVILSIMSISNNNIVLTKWITKICELVVTKKEVRWIKKTQIGQVRSKPTVYPW